MTLYLAGGLFNAGERLHNLYLEKYLRALGHEVILPQREALRFFDGHSFDIASIVGDCQASVCNPQNIFVGSSDGADADGGTCVEYGMAIIATGRALVYRTDFRTDLKKEIGMNAMLGARNTRFVYFPAYFTTLDEADTFYTGLAQKINEALQDII